MREIKFRAWDKEENRWYQPVFEAYKGKLHELFVTFGGQLVAHTLNGINHESIFPDRYILQMCTGLKDENGEDVYEGDIIKYDFRPCIEQLGVIIFQDGRYSVKGTNNWMPLKFEIVGNIYQNLELLKGE